MSQPLIKTPTKGQAVQGEAAEKGRDRREWLWLTFSFMDPFVYLHFPNHSPPPISFLGRLVCCVESFQARTLPLALFTSPAGSMLQNKARQPVCCPFPPSQVGLVNELVPDDSAALEEAARKLAQEMLQCTAKVVLCPLPWQSSLFWSKLVEASHAFQGVLAQV